jgi:DNA recombination protein RmuC
LGSLLAAIMEIVYCAICLVVGAVVTGLIVAARYGAVLRFLAERKASLEAECAQEKSDSAGAQAKVVALTAELSTARADLKNALSRLTDYGKEVEEMQGRLKVEFENLANRVLEEKSSKFATQNQTNLDQLLTPLRQQMGEFKSRVDAVHTEDTADRAALRAQIESLTRASAEMSCEAKGLTLALKGDSKTQGSWGELILEKILESSGLTRGDEFTVQGALKNDEGANLRPDVVIHLPEGRHFVVDSKVSLTAYERYCNEADADEQRKALKEHVLSVRKHVDELAEKKYQDLYQIATPDFVFMFVPVEPAFSRALQSDRALFNDAFERKVILVTPSTLLATLRTVAHIWKQEKQTRFALEIAKRSGALYDKFVGLYGDLTEIGVKLNATTEAYHAALNKLKDGKGNLVKSVEDIKKLGARASKGLPQVLVQEASESDALAGGEEK